MHARMSHVLAAAIAAAAFSHAQAQIEPPAGLVAEPVASTSKPGGTGPANAIVEALNADPTMKHSKITVQPEAEGSVLLTGVTLTREQMRRAMETATAHAGEGKVSNAIATHEIFIDVAGTTPDEPGDLAPDEAGTTVGEPSKPSDT